MDDVTDDSDGIRERLIAGDQQALAELFAIHRQRLWRVAHFRTDSRLSARIDPDDILQDAFLDASRRLHHYTEESPYSPFVWLRMTVAQTLSNVHRRHLGTKQRDAGREMARGAGAAPDDTVMSIANFLMGHFTSPSMAAVKTEQSAKIREAVEEMDTIDREVVAASVRYVRAIVRLKKALGDSQDFKNIFNNS